MEQEQLFSSPLAAPGEKFSVPSSLEESNGQASSCSSLRCAWGGEKSVNLWFQIHFSK